MVWSLLTMFLNCSSSRAVRAPSSSPVMRGSMAPVSRLGTLKVSPRLCALSIKLDQSNKWIKLKRRHVKACQTTCITITYPSLSPTIWSRNFCTSVFESMFLALKASLKADLSTFPLITWLQGEIIERRVQSNHTHHSLLPSDLSIISSSFFYAFRKPDLEERFFTD